MNEFILIIEDDEALRSTLFDVLELENFNVISAENGCLGLRLAQELQPDLIICDINMPDIDGYEVLKKLRENFNTAKIPVIIFTSETDSDSRHRALQLGANDYLTKPMKLNKFLDAIANQLQRLQTV